MKRIAVIGAGAAGLCAARHLAFGPDAFRVSVYEQTSEIGGTWVYRPQGGEHSSMYQNLRTNIPKEVMAFPDFPFPAHLSSFPCHTDVWRYLDDYAKHYHLFSLITFNCRVTKVAPLPTPDDRKGGDCLWQVTLQRFGGLSDSEWKETFDAIVVCNGHYFSSIVPVVSGMENFTGPVIHSHDYRKPEVFSGQTVLVVGTGASGQDLALDVAKQAKRVIISARKDKQITCALPDNIELCLAVVAVSEDGSVRFEDGTGASVDSIIWCTGYSFAFPFLTSDCGITVELGRRVQPLYKHLFHCRHPSMAFIGIPYTIAPFPLFDRQAQTLAAVFSGKVSLPTTEEMLEWERCDYTRRLEEGLKPHYAHVLGDAQWPYNSDLAKMAGIDELPSFMARLYRHVHSRRRTTLMNYRDEEYKILSDDDFEILQAAS